MNKFFHESGRSGQALGTVLMKIKKDLLKILNHENYRYTFTKCENDYTLSFIRIENKEIKNFVGRDPDELFQKLINELGKEKEDERRKENQTL